MIQGKNNILYFVSCINYLILFLPFFFEKSKSSFVTWFRSREKMKQLANLISSKQKYFFTIA